jgi:hypothetical protein
MFKNHKSKLPKSWEKAFEMKSPTGIIIYPFLHFQSIDEMVSIIDDN